MSEISDVDVVIVGAGFAGMYQLHRMREAGFRAVVLEAADDVGGTWYWNRYPGARCDILTVDYSYSWDPELEQDWEWSERYATQPEILRYAQYVADKHDLRRDIRFDTRVVSAEWDDASSTWTIHTDAGDDVRARYYVMATGCLSMPKVPDIEGTDRFQGDVHFTSTWPHDGVDFTGKRVGVIGTGSSGIQSIPIIAEQASELTVFQRTPNFSIPAHNGPIADERLAEYRRDPAAYREAARHSMIGVPRTPPDTSALAVSDEERTAAYEAVWQRGELAHLSPYNDTGTNPEANDTMRRFIHDKIRSIVDDPDVAEALCPTNHYFATKRPCLDTGYFETYNLPHVRLVDLQEEPIETVTETGVDTIGPDGVERHELDAIVFATGFDAMTGAIVGVDIRGRDGVSLREAWDHGPQTYLGLMSVGFPNLFMITGPGSPSVLSNMMVSIEQHVDWITDALEHLRSEGADTIEPTELAQTKWVQHSNDIADLTLLPTANSWYMGANVPGKPRVFLPYPGGVGPYREICDEVVERGYLGFAVDGPSGRTVNDGVIRPLKPDVAIVLQMMEELGLPPIESLPVDEARAFMEASAEARPPGPDVGDIVDGTLPGAAGELAYRLYRPATPGPHPLVVYFHGGGWVLGSSTSDDPLCRDLCVRSGAVIVSVDYRHAPEHRFPAAADDGVAAVTWIAEHAEELGGVPGALAVAGWSAGANVATVTCQQIELHGGPTIVGQVLLNPVVDCDMSRPSYVDNAEGYVLTRSLLEWFFDHYCDPDERTDPRCSPLRADDLSGLPPAMVVTCEFDPLRDEGDAYAEALAAAGVPVRHLRCEGQTHTSLGAVDIVVTGAYARAGMADALRDFLAAGIAAGVRPPPRHPVGSVVGMSRDRAPHIAQGTWRSGSLHVWGWNGSDTASMAWLYGGFRRHGPDGRPIGWHDSPVSYGVVGRVTLELPGHPTLHASSVQLDPLGVAVWLSELPGPDDLSDSLAWFARIAELARRTVSAGRLAPVLDDEGPFTVARWRPVTTPEIDDVLERLAGSMPPICTAGSGADVAAIFDRLVDGIGRALLHQSGWKADLGRQRKPAAQALRATFGALSKPDHVVRSGTDEFDGALAQLRDELDRHARRLRGEPVVVPRVRLVISDDPHDPWIVRLEVVDDADSTRWCTANDVWDRDAAAVDVARGADHVDSLVTVVEHLVERVAVLPGLADLAVEHEPTQIELDLDVAEEFLDIAPAELERMGIELLGPERLVRRRVRVAGEATPAPADDRRRHFGKEALVDWKLVVDGEEISDTELARAEEAGATLLHTGHRWVRIDPDELRRRRRQRSELEATTSTVAPLELLRLANDADLGDDEAPAIAVAADGIDDNSGGDNRGDTTWMRTLLDGLPDERLTETREAPEFVGELRHYQRRALSWLDFLARLGLGGCLADDMGLGKTATTLAHLLGRPGPHLVVCPLSVVRNWSQEAARFTPKLDVTIHHGANRRQSSTDDTLFADEPERRLVITTYGLLPRDLEHLAEIDWSTVVLDEAQMVKNPNTKAARAVRRLRADQKLALTGTPVENRLSELWSILDAVDPGLLGSLPSFRERFGTPIERRGDEQAAARLRRLTRPFVLRRTKADKRLLPDLPDKIEQVAYAKLTREQATLYQQVVDQLLADADQTEGMRRRGLVLAALMRLKQICNHPAHALSDGSRLAGRSGKLSRFDELVTELLDADERALVFTQFREMGELLRRHVVEQFHLDAPFLHGGVARGGRDRMIDAFQDGSGPPLLLVSLKAGGTGLNLTAASQVIHYDRWWNPAVEDQATDRAWRIGQHRTVNVHKLVCEGTVEERIGAVIDDKRKLADAVVGNGEAWLSELSTDELRELVVYEADE